MEDRAHPLRTVDGLIATWFGIGLIPIAPGTWGSLAAVIVGAAIVSTVGTGLVLLPLAAAFFVIGARASERYAARLHSEDPASVVIDEVVGQWLVLAFLPPDLLFYVFGFLLFRVFDIFKPWPVSWAEDRFSGGWGIMADDVIAALYALLAFAAAAFLMATAGAGWGT